MLVRYMFGAAANTGILSVTSIDDFVMKVSAVHNVAQSELRIEYDGSRVLNSETLEAIIKGDSKSVISVAHCPKSSEKSDGDTDEDNSDTGPKSADSPSSVSFTPAKRMCLENTPQSVTKLTPFQTNKSTPETVDKPMVTGFDKLLQQLLSEDPIGQDVLTSQKDGQSLDDESLQIVLGIICRYMDESRQGDPATKHGFAMAFIKMFPEFKDSRSEYGCEAIYCRADHRGKLEWKWKNYMRAKRRGTVKEFVKGVTGSRKRKMAFGNPDSPKDYRDPHMDDESEDPDGNMQVEIQRAICWLTLNVGSGQLSEIEPRHQMTLKYRLNKLHSTDENDEPVTAGDILEEFPCFQSTPGLVGSDFKKLFPEKHDKLMENWAFINEKVGECARAKLSPAKLADGSSVSVWLGQLDNCGSADCPHHDAAIRLLVSLLPPQNLGKKVPKISVEAACKLLLDYQPVGTDVDHYLVQRAGEYKEPRSPYLLLIGKPHKIEAAFVIVDHRPIPTSKLLARALDDLFKSCYVFNVHYQPELNHFFEFIQTGVFQIGQSRLPTVRMLATKFGFQ